MKSNKNFIKNTIIGGAFFLLPLAVLLILMGKLFTIAQKVVHPLADAIGIDKIAGVRVSWLLALFLILLGCFLAGLLGRTRIAKRMIKWVEDNLLVIIPGYAYMKELGEDVAGISSESLKIPVLAWIEDSWQLGFQVDIIDNNYIAIFIPGVPSPKSGALYFLQHDRVKPVEITSAEANSIFKKMGLDTSSLLKNKLPAK